MGHADRQDLEGSEDCGALQPQDKATIADWIREELAEFELARSNADELDALYDMLGIIAMAMLQYGAARIDAASEAFVQSQVRRGRANSPWRRAAIMFGASMSAVLDVSGTASSLARDALAWKARQRGWR